MSNQKLSISVENLAPERGTSITPVWVGFHDGRFDTYDRGEAVTAGLESLAEDGSTALISDEFNASGFGDVDTTVGGAPIAPGDTVRATVEVDPHQGRYFNYASMVLPSNDTFIANGNPLAFEIFDEAGNFVGTEFVVAGSQALDAGTEVNDEVPANTAFFGQQTPDTGIDENGVVTLATGFNPIGSGGILDSPDFANADYTQPGYNFARIRVANLVEGNNRSNKLFGTNAQDDIFAGRGNDHIFSGEGNDHIYAGRGSDSIVAGNGDNVIDTGLGRDVVKVGNGDNLISTGNGRDNVLAGNGNNEIYTGRGRDVVKVGYGVNLISTGNGRDTILTGNGDNVIDAGAGNDLIYTGKGSDTFVLNAGSGADSIFNYGSNDQFILGSGLDSDTKIHVDVNGRDTIISSGGDTLAILKDVQTYTIDIV